MIEIKGKKYTLLSTFLLAVFSIVVFLNFEKTRSEKKYLYVNYLLKSSDAVCNFYGCLQIFFGDEKVRKDNLIWYGHFENFSPVPFQERLISLITQKQNRVEEISFEYSKFKKREILPDEKEFIRHTRLRANAHYAFAFLKREDWDELNLDLYRSFGKMKRNNDYLSMLSVAILSEIPEAREIALQYLFEIGIKPELLIKIWQRLPDIHEIDEINKRLSEFKERKEFLQHYSKILQQHKTFKAYLKNTNDSYKGKNALKFKNFDVNVKI